MIGSKGKIVIAGALVALVTGCTQGQVDRLEWVGKEPPMNSVSLPERHQDKVQPIRWPVAQQKSEKPSANTLWSNNSRHFFKDQRAHSIGDILTVKVDIKDSANLDNKTERKRKNSEKMGVPSLFGMEQNLVGFLPGKANPASLLSMSGNTDNSGEGIIEREEQISTEVAAVVTQVMPNGNLVIYGSQEIRVNYEVRQLTVEGVIRAEDIGADNMVPSNRIAEARISYGGKGLISDVQQPRMGSQIVDILSPW